MISDKICDKEYLKNGMKKNFSIEKKQFETEIFGLNKIKAKILNLLKQLKKQTKPRV